MSYQIDDAQAELDEMLYKHQPDLFKERVRAAAVELVAAVAKAAEESNLAASPNENGVVRISWPGIPGACVDLFVDIASGKPTLASRDGQPIKLRVRYDAGRGRLVASAGGGCAAVQVAKVIADNLEQQAKPALPDDDDDDDDLEDPRSSLRGGYY